VGPSLRADAITLRFGGVTALQDVSLEVGRDELVALIGPNGAGKSSLLNVLSGFYRPKSGRIEFEGADITGWPVHRVARSGLVRTFQGTHLFSNMSVIDNILVGRYSQMRSGMAAGISLLSLDPTRRNPAPGGGRGNHRLPRDRTRAPPAGGHAGLRHAQARGPGPRVGDGAAKCCCWTSPWPA
jgi:ABC-type sugar transport system ATPase subunit